MEIKNAKISHTFLGCEDHGIFTCSIGLDYGGSAQSFGSHELYYKHYGIKYLDTLLKTLEVRSWEDLVGTVVRVKASYSHIEAIGHFMKDQWFNPERDLDKKAQS